VACGDVEGRAGVEDPVCVRILLARTRILFFARILNEGIPNGVLKRKGALKAAQQGRGQVLIRGEVLRKSQLISRLRLTAKEQQPIRRRLLNHHGMQLVPLSPFGFPVIVRLDPAREEGLFAGEIGAGEDVDEVGGR
jgi:hypothetical protein